MVEAVEKPGDTCAICLTKMDHSVEREVGGTCAGMQYDYTERDGTIHVKPWAMWIKNKQFDIAAGIADEGKYREPVGAEEDGKWKLADLSLDVDAEVTGNAGSSWSVFRYLVKEGKVDLPEDYRFSAGDTDL